MLKGRTLTFGMCQLSQTLSPGANLSGLLVLSFAGVRWAVGWSGLHVQEVDGEIVVTSGDFRAVYYKPSDHPLLALRSRTISDNHALLARSWQAANDKARELGWIV
jgi:hypothetical protein